MKHKELFFLTILLFPQFCFASVRVTEIMYDLEGADSGREWVEIENTGSTAIDLSTYKFFDKDGGHLLRSFGSGTTEIPAGAFMIIADKPDVFLTDHAGFSGLLIDSSFSLTSAETVGIKNAEGVVIDSIAYTSDLGARGDGNSLQRISASELIASTPTPGSATVVSTSPPASSSSGGITTTNTTSASETSAPQSSQAPVAPIKRITVDAGGDRVVTVGASALFSAKVFGTIGEPISNPRLIWNFGNGEEREGKTISFAYEYPGEYTLMVSGASGEYSAVDRVLVTAVSADVALLYETDGTVSLLNRERRDVDVSLWRLRRGDSEFLIPENTTVAGGQKIPFSSKTTGLPTEGEAELLYPNGVSAVRGSLASKAVVSPVQSGSVSISSNGKKQVASVSIAVDSADSKEETAENSKEEAPDRQWVLWFLGSVSLALLGAGSVVFMRMGKAEREPSLSSVADTYEIIE